MTSTTDRRSEVCAEGRHGECQGHGTDGPCGCTHPAPAGTPVDELRAAAQLLRKRGAEATPGPWHRPLNTRYKHVVTAAKPDDEQGRYLDGRPEQVGVVQLNIWSNGAHERKRGGRDLEWIALASPLLAEPMADQLDAVADQYDADHQFPVRGVACHCWTNDPMCRTALATARAINRSQP